MFRAGLPDQPEESAVLLSYLFMIEILAGRQPGFYDFRFSWKLGAQLQWKALG
jgi:hypothetical protein